MSPAFFAVVLSLLFVVDSVVFSLTFAVVAVVESAVVVVGLSFSFAQAANEINSAKLKAITSILFILSPLSFKCCLLNVEFWMLNKSLLAYWLISLLANGGETMFRIFKNFEFWMLNFELWAGHPHPIVKILRLMRGMTGKAKPCNLMNVEFWMLNYELWWRCSATHCKVSSATFGMTGKAKPCNN